MVTAYVVADNSSNAFVRCPLARGLAFAGLVQILLDVVCLGLSAAVGVDTLLGRALLALSGVNILLTVLMIGKCGKRHFSWFVKRTAH